MSVNINNITQSIQNTALSKQGLQDELKLESEAKSGPVAFTKDNEDLMLSSFQGFKASHPDASLQSFAQQEGPKVGLDANDVENMVNSAISSILPGIANVSDNETTPITRSSAS